MSNQAIPIQLTDKDGAITFPETHASLVGYTQTVDGVTSTVPLPDVVSQMQTDIAAPITKDRLDDSIFSFSSSNVSAAATEQTDGSYRTAAIALDVKDKVTLPEGVSLLSSTGDVLFTATATDNIYTVLSAGNYYLSKAATSTAADESIDYTLTSASIGGASADATMSATSTNPVQNKAVYAAINAEQTRAAAAEQTNAADILEEKNRAMAAEQVNATAVTTEKNRAMAAEQTNATAITTEKNRAMAAEDLKAPLASPALTGTPTAPTAASGTNTTQIANTQFVTSAVAAETAARESAVSSEASARAAAITAEQNARQTADTSLRDDLNAQIAKEAADVANINEAITNGVGTTTAIVQPSMTSADTSVTDAVSAKGIVDYVKEQVDTATGDLSSLKTDEKNNLVGAINEQADDLDEIAQKVFKITDNDEESTFSDISNVEIWRDGEGYIVAKMGTIASGKVGLQVVAIYDKDGNEVLNSLNETIETVNENTTTIGSVIESVNDIINAEGEQTLSSNSNRFAIVDGQGYIGLLLDENGTLKVKKVESEETSGAKAEDGYFVNVANSLSNGQNLQIENTPNIKSWYCLGFSALVGTMGTISLSHGEQKYRYGRVDVDSTNIYIYTFPGADASPSVLTTIAHGLTISGDICISVITNGKYGVAKVKVTSNGQSYTTDEVTFNGCIDNAKVAVSDGTYTNCSLTIGGVGYSKDVWIFGDSYTDYWPQYMNDFGATNFMLDGYSGRNSSSAYPSLVKNLEVGKPKRIVWMLGMNDQDSTTAISSAYKTALDDLVELCKSKGIALSVATIPNTPTRCHTFKNSYIRSIDGIQVIDNAKMFGADTYPSTWREGLRQSNEDVQVHPSSKGSKLICSSLMAQIPSIINN